ncbi:hypothetical protein V2W45_880165 [Cenococcum geophilum]
MNQRLSHLSRLSTRHATPVTPQLTYITPLFPNLTTIKNSPTSPLTPCSSPGTTTPPSSKHHRTSLIPTLHNTALSSPLQTRRALPPYASSSRRLVLELVTSLALCGTLFFLFHLALHTIPPLRSLHTPHHAQLHPQATNQLLANFSVNVNGSHVLTRPAFVPVFVWLIDEIHSGLELLKEWGGGARKHWMHHRGGEGSFGPFFEGSGGSSVGN